MDIWVYNLERNERGNTMGILKKELVDHKKSSLGVTFIA
jgi:hypothetical protein